MKLYWVERLPGYCVDDLGVVYTTKCGRFRPMKCGVDRDGYLKFTATIHGRPKRTGAHQFACEAFHGPRPDGACVRHLNGIPSDNRLSNLTWGTSKQNTEDRKAHGTYLFGELCPSSKLTESQAIELIGLRKQGLRLRELATRFGINQSAVSHICCGRNWKHLQEHPK